MGGRGQRNSGPQCQLIFRGHINWYDYVGGALTYGVPRERIHFMTFLREPVSRAISEYNHITGIFLHFTFILYCAASFTLLHRL